jgi:hypothetical protein
LKGKISWVTSLHLGCGPGYTNRCYNAYKAMIEENKKPCGRECNLHFEELNIF